jgi:Co/Zn/Cd efflux system component
MSAGCTVHSATDGQMLDKAWRRVLWAVLIINAGMFVIEGASGLFAGSVSLQADSLDFLGDSANYAISLYVVGRTVSLRAGSALIKAASMALFGCWVIGMTVYHAIVPGLPNATTMGTVGFLALTANLAAAFLLYRYRSGDANMRSVWLCTRNDAAGNLAVMVAASGVFVSQTLWPDLAVGLLLAGLALSSSFQVFRQAMAELKNGETSKIGFTEVP